MSNLLEVDRKLSHDNSRRLRFRRCNNFAHNKVNKVIKIFLHRLETS